MQRQIGLWLVCCFFAASLVDRRVGAAGDFHKILLLITQCSGPFRGSLCSCICAFLRLARIDKVLTTFGAVAPGSKGPLALQPFTPEEESKSGLLFLLQLIGPDCHSDQQELPQHLTQALSELLDTVKPESIGLLNFSSPNGQLSEPGRTLLQGKGVPEEEEPLISASWSQPRSRFLADEQPHHGQHSALRRLLQGMNSQEPALMFLYAAEPQHDHEAVHLQLSEMVASGRLGDAIRAVGFKLSDIHLVAFEPVFGDHMPHEGISGMSVRRSWLMLCTCIGQ
jgi:hypothetical protein